MTTKNDQIRYAQQHVQIRIVDDDLSMRDALTFFLQLEGWFVNSYDSVRDFLTQDTASIPGCIVMDIKMPDISGLEAQQILKDRGVDLPLIFITGHGDVEMAVRAIKEGAVDFLLKPFDNDRLLHVIEDACVNYINEKFGDAQLVTLEKAFNTLTAREAEIAVVLSQGLSNREIAERFNIAVRTAEVHCASTLRKLGIKRDVIQGFETHFLTWAKKRADVQQITDRYRLHMHLR